MNTEQEMFNSQEEEDITELKCEHFVMYLECEECMPKLSRRQAANLLEFFKKKHREFGAARRKRVKALNKKFFKQKQQEAGTHQRSITIRFNLDDAPLPIKDRELLYKDYQRSKKGIKEQWAARLLELDNDEEAWRKDLVAMAARRGFTS